MGPKVDAVCRFVELTGGIAAIGPLEDAAAILRGEAGTVVTASGRYPASRRSPGAPGSRVTARSGLRRDVVGGEAPVLGCGLVRMDGHDHDRALTLEAPRGPGIPVAREPIPIEP